MTWYRTVLPPGSPRVQVYLPRDIYDSLNVLARMRGLTSGVIIERGIRREITQEKREGFPTEGLMKPPQWNGR